MANNIAELQASIKIKTEEAQRGIDNVNKRINELNKNFELNGKLTVKEQNELKRLTKTLEDLRKIVTKTAQEEQKLANIREKGANDVKNKSIINEQKLATEREKTRKITAQAEATELRLSNMKEKLNAKNNQGLGIWSKLSTRITVAGLAVNTITGLFNKLTESIRASYTEAIRFQKEMSMVNTLSNLSRKDLEKMGKELINMGENMGRTPEEMAKGMLAVKSITDDTVDSMKVLETATKASVAMSADLSSTVNTGVGVINAYGMEISNLEHVYDVMFKTTDIGNVTMEQLNQHLGNVVSSAVRAKVPFETLMGQLAFMTKNGVETAESTTALARAYDAIYQKNDKMKELFNIDVADKNGKLKDTMTILKELSDVLSGYDEISQINLLDKLGIEVRGQKAVQTFIESLGDANEVLKQTGDTAGGVAKAFEQASDNIATETIKNQGRMLEAMNNFRIKNEKAIISVIKTWVDFKIAVLNTFEFITKLGQYIYELPMKWTHPIKWWKEVFNNKPIEDTKESIKELNTELKNTNSVQDFFTTSKVKDWSGSLIGYFQAVIDGSKDMSTEVAKDVLAMLDSYSIMIQKMPKAKVIGVMAKQARLEGMPEEEVEKNIVKPLQALDTKDINEAKAKVQEIINRKPVKLKTYNGKDDKKDKTPYDFIKENEQNLKELKALQLSDGEYWKKREDFLESAIKNMVQDGQKTKVAEDLMLEARGKTKGIENAKKKAEQLKKNQEDFDKFLQDTQDDLNESLDKENEYYANKIKAYNDIFKEEESYTLIAKMLGKNTDTAEYRKAMNDLYDKQIEEIILLYGDTQEAKDKIKAIQDKKFNVEKTVSLDEKLTATSSLISELGNALEDDLIGALGNTIDSISSIVRIGSQMKAFGGTGSNLIGGLGIATAVIGVVGSVVQQLKWAENVSGTEQEKANNKFTEAVDKFEESVNNMNIGQKINFAKMYKPSAVYGDITSGVSNIDEDAIQWGANNAGYDASKLIEKLKGGDYSNIDINAIMSKYAYRKDFINSANWFQKDSQIVGYDIAGAMAEINKLISEAYKKNLENFKEAIGLTTDAFANGLMDALEGGDIDKVLEKLNTDALKKAYINQEAFTTAFKVLGNKQMESILSVMGLKAKSEDELSKMSAEEITAYIKDMMKGFPELMKQFGLGLDNANNSLNKFSDSVKTNDLPSVIKLITLENQSSRGYNSGTNYYIQTVYGSVDSQFRNMVNKSVANDTTKRTGN